MTSQLPSDTHAVGDSGHTSDHNNIVDVLATITGVSAGSSVTRQAALNGLAGAQTSGDYLRGDGTNVSMSAIQSGDLPASGVTAGSYTTADITVDSAGRVTAASNGTAGVVAADVWLSGLALPSGALAETYPRLLAGGGLSVVSETVYFTAIGLTAGTTVTNIAFHAGGSAGAAATHGWYALLDSTGKVLATTADQTSAWLSAGAVSPLPLTSPYTVPVGGLFYVAFCETTTSGPSLIQFNRGSNELASPLLCGTAGTAFTTPPTVGTTLTLTASSACPWAYVS